MSATPDYYAVRVRWHSQCSEAAFYRRGVRRGLVTKATAKQSAKACLRAGREMRRVRAETDVEVVRMTDGMLPARKM